MEEEGIRDAVSSVEFEMRIGDAAYYSTVQYCAAMLLPLSPFHTRSTHEYYLASHGPSMKLLFDLLLHSLVGWVHTAHTYTAVQNPSTIPDERGELLYEGRQKE